jgi:hypothetical protein
MTETCQAGVVTSLGRLQLSVSFAMRQFLGGWSFGTSTRGLRFYRRCCEHFRSACLHGSIRMKDFCAPAHSPRWGAFLCLTRRFPHGLPIHRGIVFWLLVEVLTRVVTYREGAPEWRRMKSPP